jgi:hypothetical protein
MITVVNKRTHKGTPKDFYIGRPSPLGNPYSHKDNTLAKFKTESREESVELYKKWLLKRIQDKDPLVLTALKSIPKDANLVCWCAPLACHGDVIKEVLEDQ